MQAEIAGIHYRSLTDMTARCLEGIFRRELTDIDATLYFGAEFEIATLGDFNGRGAFNDDLACEFEGESFFPTIQSLVSMPQAQFDPYDPNLLFPALILYWTERALCEEGFRNMEIAFYTSLGTMLDYLYGADAFILINGYPITLDVTTDSRENPSYSDVRVYLSMIQGGVSFQEIGAEIAAKYFEYSAERSSRSRACLG
jgi:hypothetical protein